MLRYTLSLLVLFAALAGLFHLAATEGKGRAADGPTVQQPPLAAPGPFTLALQTNRRSELEPCGCARNQQGGIDREARIFQDLDDLGAVVLKLEGGGFTDNLMTENERLKTRFMLQALHLTGYHCLNVGAGDLAYGLAALRDEASTLTLISANVRTPGERELPFDPFRVFELTRAATGETLRVGVVGVSGPPPGSIVVPLDQVAVSGGGPGEDTRPPAGGGASAGVRPLQPPRTRIVEVDVTLPMAGAEGAPEPGGAPEGTGLVIPEGTFDTSDEEETGYDAPPAAPPAPAPAAGRGGALLAPSAADRALAAAAARWHDGPSKGDGEEAPFASKAEAPKGEQRLEDVLARVPTSPLAYGKAGAVEDVTAADAALAALLAESRAALAALPSASAHERNTSRVELIDARAALDVVVPALRPRVDVLVVLWYDSEQPLLRAAEGLEGVDVILSGEVGNRYETLRSEAGQTVFRASYDGRIMALMGLERGADGAVARTLAMREIASDGATTPEVSAVLLAYRLTQRAEAQRRASQPPIVVAPGSGESNRIYVGAQSCQDCHEKEYESWATTPHATAINTLIDAAAEYNPDCIACHVTGLPPATNITERGGFVSVTRTPHMANVQCEVCHGPGWQHVTNMRRALYYERTNRMETTEQILAASKGLMIRSPDAASCRECHVPKTGEFDFDERVPFVDHSQHYPEERRQTHQAKAVDMMAAFLEGGK